LRTHPPHCTCRTSNSEPFQQLASHSSSQTHFSHLNNLSPPSHLRRVLSIAHIDTHSTRARPTYLSTRHLPVKPPRLASELHARSLPLPFLAGRNTSDRYYTILKKYTSCQQMVPPPHPLPRKPHGPINPPNKSSQASFRKIKMYRLTSLLRQLQRQVLRLRWHHRT